MFVKKCTSYVTNPLEVTKFLRKKICFNKRQFFGSKKSGRFFAEQRLLLETALYLLQCASFCIDSFTWIVQFAGSHFHWNRGNNKNCMHTM